MQYYSMLLYNCNVDRLNKNKENFMYILPYHYTYHTAFISFITVHSFNNESYQEPV